MNPYNCFLLVVLLLAAAAAAALGTRDDIVREAIGADLLPFLSPPPPPSPKRVNNTPRSADVSAASKKAEEQPPVQLQGLHSHMTSSLTIPRQAAVSQHQSLLVTLLDVGSSGKADLKSPGSPRLSIVLHHRLLLFTLCLWIKPHRLHQVNNVVYLGDARHRHFLQLSLNRGEVAVHAARCHHKFGVFLGVRKWHHLCLVLGRDSAIYHGGEAVPSSSRCAPSSDGGDFPAENLVIGGSLWGGTPFSGLLADVRLYDAPLPEDQVRVVAEGHKVSRSGFMLDESVLTNASISAENVEFVTVDIKNLTSEAKNYYFYFEEKVTFIHAASLCRNVGGTLVMISEANREEILSALLKYSGGVGDVAGDSWALLPESLNSDTSNSCPLLRAYQNPATLQDEDGDCESTASVLCHLPEEHRLRLLGLQEEVTLYPIHNSLNVFEDGGNYRLIATGERVKLENVQSSNTLYERVSSSTRQVTGRYKWILPDNTENNNKNRSEVFLTLTGCREDQFTCSDGGCVSLENVCNLVNDCQDATDELLCTDRTFLPDTYSKRFSPSQGTNDQTLVGLKITLEQVNHVELTENLLKVVLRLDVMWRDPRVVFKYLQKDASVILPEEAVQEMWLPCIDLVTAAPEYKSSADFPNMKDKVVTATARTEGFSTVLGHTEVKAFPGAFTDLQAARTDEIAFICPLDLFFYPFDVQVCKMPLRLTGPVNDATWNATHMSTALGDHLTLTLLYAHQFAVRLHPDQETAVVVVKLGRRYDAYFINTMLPCMLLEVIGFLTHAFPIQDFSNRCTATLSCLIVKAAFFLQISGTLPKTADPKLVDVWMFGNVFVLSLIFLAHVAVLHVQRRSETSKNTPKEGCVAWDEEVTQQGNGYRLARFVNLVGLATSMLVCIMLLSGIGVAAARGKMAALLL